MGLTHKFLRLLTSFCGRKPVKSIKSPYFWFSVLRDVRIEVSRSLKLSDGGRETIKSRMTSLWILKCGVGCIWSSIRVFLVVYREDVPSTRSACAEQIMKNLEYFIGLTQALNLSPQQDSENYHTASCFGFPSVLFVAYLISDIRNLR